MGIGPKETRELRRLDEHHFRSRLRTASSNSSFTVSPNTWITVTGFLIVILHKYLAEKVKPRGPIDSGRSLLAVLAT